MLEFRYQEFSDGYMNYNNSSFFSNKLMENVLAGWLEGVPLKIFLAVHQVNINDKSGYKLDPHLIGEAAAFYLALKESPSSSGCFTGGSFPDILVLGAIRNVSFHMNPNDVIYTNEEC